MGFSYQTFKDALTLQFFFFKIQTKKAPTISRSFWSRLGLQCHISSGPTNIHCLRYLSTNIHCLWYPSTNIHCRWYPSTNIHYLWYPCWEHGALSCQDLWCKMTYPHLFKEQVCRNFQQSSKEGFISQHPPLPQNITLFFFAVSSLSLHFPSSNFPSPFSCYPASQERCLASFFSIENFFFYPVLANTNRNTTCVWYFILVFWYLILVFDI